MIVKDLFTLPERAAITVASAQALAEHPELSNTVLALVKALDSGMITSADSVELIAVLSAFAIRVHGARLLETEPTRAEIALEIHGEVLSALRKVFEAFMLEIA